MANITTGGLGRRVPEDFEHVKKYPLSAFVAETPDTVEHILYLPWWHRNHDQGHEGACVGFGTSMMMAITNTHQNQEANLKRPWTRRYDPWWLWDEAKKIDEWDDTNPGDDEGTSVRAACEVSRVSGLVRVTPVSEQPVHQLGIGTPSPAEGVGAYRWAHTVDEMRAGIANGLPISIGVSWYENFDGPVWRGGDSAGWWIGVDSSGHPTTDLGDVRGGHCVCIYGASDRRQAFRVKNSWGPEYPLVWLPYGIMNRLLSDDGEAALITDR